MLTNPDPSLSDCILLRIYGKEDDGIETTPHVIYCIYNIYEYNYVCIGKRGTLKEVDTTSPESEDYYPFHLYFAQTDKLCDFITMFFYKQQTVFDLYHFRNLPDEVEKLTFEYLESETSEPFFITSALETYFDSMTPETVEFKIKKILRLLSHEKMEVPCSEPTKTNFELYDGNGGP